MDGSKIAWEKLGIACGEVKMVKLLPDVTVRNES